MDERIMVMGVGNPLVRDEGVGPRVADELAARFEFAPAIEIVDAGTMGMAIFNLFRECDILIVVDAVQGTGYEPGTVVRLAPEDLASNQVMHSLHDVRLVDVLAAAEFAGTCPRADFVGVQVADMSGIEMGLTPQVEAAVPAAVEAVIGVLGEYGVTATPKRPNGADADRVG